MGSALLSAEAGRGHVGRHPGARPRPRAVKAEPAGHARLTPAHTRCPATAALSQVPAQVAGLRLLVFSYAT